MEASKIFRFEFSESLVEKLGAFSKQNEMVDRETYKDEWKKWLDDNQRIVVYKRMTNEEGMIEEELYISNKEYDQKLGAFYNKLEEDEYKEDIN